VPGNAVVLMNTHYLNAAPQPLDTEARITVWPVDPASVSDEAGVLFFYNFWIAVPPHGEAEARMRCPIRRDLTLYDAQSHMHARGVGYDASLLHADGTSQPLYASQSWENVPVTTFAPGQPLPAGSAIDYRCRYHNDEERLVVQGLTTRDEMCMFIGVYWPRDEVTERCALDADYFTSDFAATHVGHGTTACADSLDCFAAATADDRGAGFSACIDASCPAQAELLWRAQRCRFQHGDHADTECIDELAACRAKTTCS
jgi:hypothetical protein